MDGAESTRLSIAARLMLALIGVYRVIGSPFLGGQCRFQPSCSVYAAEAVRRHGAWRGGRLAARRVARCHPFGSSGYDPVPGIEPSRDGGAEASDTGSQGRSTPG